MQVLDQRAAVNLLISRGALRGTTDAYDAAKRELQQGGNK